MARVIVTGPCSTVTVTDYCVIVTVILCESVVTVCTVTVADDTDCD